MLRNVISSLHFEYMLLPSPMEKYDVLGGMTLIGRNTDVIFFSSSVISYTWPTEYSSNFTTLGVGKKIISGSLALKIGYY